MPELDKKKGGKDRKENNIFLTSPIAENFVKIKPYPFPF